MYTQTVYMQTEYQVSEIICGIVETAISVQPVRMLSSVSYASFSGCKLLQEKLFAAIPTWNSVRKDWLIGLDSGITEPEALKYLAKLPNSYLHLFDAEYLLNNNLQPRQKFHTKMYIFESPKNNVTGIFSGSANLTLSGLVINMEQGISVICKNPIAEAERESLEKLNQQKMVLKRIFKQSIGYSPKLYQRYKEMCEKKREFVKNEDHHRTPRSLDTNRPEFDLSKAAAIATASNFWVEIKYVVENLGKGVPGNQIDLQRGSRVFFGFDVEQVAKNTIFGTRIIRYGNQDYECGMRFGNNQMDKLNLPSPYDIKLDTYEDKILLFTRLGDEIFNMRVYQHRDIKRFRRLSDHNKSLYKMKSGREYGVF